MRALGGIFTRSRSTESTERKVSFKKSTRITFENCTTTILFVTTKDVVDNLTKVFEGFSLKSTVVGSFISNECNLSIKRTTRYPIARNNGTKLDHRVKWVQDMANSNTSFLQQDYVFF
ncbi:uncharacterized protein BX663DRAFT_314212 [Cokeromyces recurvatus]|uniref:uncharacterized protein n=1 Tax=Cokeromyces recurvatus TaxID=90255 RepID=UPI00221E9F12|nr:uncharacterized protein BX663DRAFT_314212 [Cokeromyces recurvatus]KAI7905204.1 hypothetical protein BX663DRAFT_314212 [Cokeromyces recurvatus]